MPKQQTHIRVVRQWCQSLGVLTAISITREEAEMKLAAFVPMLMRDFPDAAFTTDSLNAVARQCVDGFPIYPVLAARLSAWWREHRPYVALPPPPPPPERTPPTPEEIAHIEATVREVVAALHSVTIERDTTGRGLWVEVPPLGPRHLTPAQLDQLNPLPNGRKRTDAALSPRTAAAVDTDAA